MSVAAQLLVEQRAIPIGDVGRLVGYAHSSHFAHAFRRRYGLLPALFRKRALRHADRHGGAGSGTGPAVSGAGARPGHVDARFRNAGRTPRSRPSVRAKRFGTRQPDPHQRSAAPSALGGDRAAVLGDDLPDDRQSQSRAGTPARLGAAVEAVEHVRHVLGGDALSVIANGQLPADRRSTRSTRSTRSSIGVAAADPALRAVCPADRRST